MTHFQLTLANITFNFRPQAVLLAGAAAIGGIVLMSAFVGTLRESVQRGETLRQAQQTAPAHVARVQTVRMQQPSTE
jgi:hypothetical protein